MPTAPSMPIWAEITLYWIGATLAGAIIYFLVNRASPALRWLTEGQQRLNGWQRVGVVLSGAWVLSIIVIATADNWPALGEVLAAMILPVLALWAGGYAAVFCVRWIAQGFGARPSALLPFTLLGGGRVELPAWALVLIVLLAVLLGVLLAPTPPTGRALY